MSEYVYKLNLPSIENIMLPGKFQEIFLNNSFPKDNIDISMIDPKTYLLPENLKIGYYDVDHSLLFRKLHGKAGVVHTDTNGIWAINYIVGGTCVLKYYDVEHLGPPTLKRDPAGSTRPIWENTASSPVKKYTMSPGVYLVSTEIPHLAIGYGNRYSLSIRVREAQQKSWESAVDFFKSVICTEF